MSAPKIANKPEQSTKKGKGGNPAWQKGVSGNPTGRPKVVAEVRELARAQTAVAIATLSRLASDKNAPAAAQVSAATALLDRAWGKPSQPIGGADDLPPIRATVALTEAELIAIAAGQADG